MGDLGRGWSSVAPPPGDNGNWKDGTAYPTNMRIRSKPDFLDDPFDSADYERLYQPPKPETAAEASQLMANKFFEEAKAAYDKGAWQTDASHHARHKKVDPDSLKNGTTLLEPQEGQRTLRMAYFFSGVKRKASIAEQLKQRCAKLGRGLIVYEVDVLVGGSEHDLLDRASQDAWLARIEDGDFDCNMLSPPCGSWSRANWANNDGPKPCRDRKHPWGIPHLRANAQRRAKTGN